MAIYSSAQSLFKPCPSFALAAVDGNFFKLSDFKEATALLIAFICNHCPYVQAIEDRFVALAHAYPKEKLQVVGVCSNDALRYPEDAPMQLLKRSQEKGYGFPYLLDETQELARQLDAVCTPDFFLYDQKRTLFYHGRLDDNWQDPGQVVQHELQQAIEAVLTGKPPPQPQHPTMGCSIKWKE